MAKCSKMRNLFGCAEFSANRDIWRAILAEFVGTLFLVLVGCASCVSGWNEDHSPHVVQVALAFGITIATIAQAIGHVSGCHLNPAVSVAMLLTGKITILRTIAYSIAQCIGAISGAAILQALTPPEFHATLGVTSLHPKVTVAQGFGIEFFATFMLLLIIFGVCDSKRDDIRGSAPLAIGLTVSAAALAIGSYTGASLNPARSLGPAVVTNSWEHHWVYWVGPIVGGSVAGMVYEKAFRARKPEEEDNRSNYRYELADAKDVKEVIADRTTSI